MHHSDRGSSEPDKQIYVHSAVKPSILKIVINFLFQIFYLIGFVSIRFFGKIGEGVIQTFTKRKVRTDGKVSRIAYWKRIVPVTLVTVIFSLIVFSSTMTVSYAVIIEGETVAYVQKEEDLDTALETINTKLISNTVEKEPKIEPMVEVSIAQKRSVVDPEELTDVLIDTTETISQGYGILADGKLVAAAADETALEMQLEGILAEAETGNENEQVEFENNVEIVEGLFLNSDFCEPENLTDILTENTTSTYYTAVEGDTIESIAENFEMTTEELLEKNPELESELQAGEILRVNLNKSLLSVKIIRTTTYTEEIPFETQESVNPEKNESYSAVVLPGTAGLREITANITYIDDVVVEKNIISSEVVKAPVKEQIIVGGTSALADSVNSQDGDGVTSGTIIWPVELVKKSYVSAFMGDGRSHMGWDIAAPVGTEIYAVDGGTVKSVNQTSSSYGQHFVIEHSNGISTLYAHCSKLFVTEGQKISQGQLVALVGSTGYSTGPHLHIEFWEGRSKLDPAEYLQDLYEELF